MPPRRRYRKKYRGKRRGKWRQQKLAVGTVKKIAREIAQNEDKKNLVKYVHVDYIKAAGFNWAPNTIAAIPPSTSWQDIAGASTLYSKLISGVGGLIRASNMTAQDGAEQGEVELRIHGVQFYGILKNTSQRPLRVETRLVYIPNTNVYTDDANDYLTPRFTMFSKSGKGLGALLRQGYDRRSLGAFDATGIPVKFKTLARKVISLPAATFAGTITAGGQVQPVAMSAPAVYKRFSMAAYFKKHKRAFVRANNDELTNGNYFFVIWHDGATTADVCRCLGTSNLQYSLKAPMNDDVAA